VGPNENIVLDSHTGRNEDEGSDLAVIPYRDSFFDIDESVDFAVLADLAFVQVHLVMYNCA
jgi:hypothetical protein